MDPRLVTIFILVIFSAIFSASESALISLSKGRIHALVKNKRYGAIILERVKANTNRFITTILIGNNIVNISASVLATLYFTEIFGSNGAGIATGVMTFIILVFGEITPKTFAIKYAETVSLFISPFILLLEYLLLPIIWFLENLLKLQHLFFGFRQEKSITEDELIALAKIGAEEGTIQQQEKELIQNVLEFNDIEVAEIMTTRTDIDALEESIEISEAARFIGEQCHTKIPVYRETIDNIVGIITVREILENIAANKLDMQLKNLHLKKPYVIPETKRINILLKELQKKRQNMAIVIDEHGGTAGIVTIEDILEEIVGEIVDEHEEQEEIIKILDKNTIVVQGKTPLYEINEALQVDLLMEDYKPVSALVLKKLKHIPKPGEKFTIDDLEFRIERMQRNKIERIKIQKKIQKKLEHK